MNNAYRYVGIMVSSPRARKQALSRYIPSRSTDLKLFSFTPSDIDWEHRIITGLYLRRGKWQQQEFSFPHVVYNRCYDPDPALIGHLESVMGRGKVFNEINRFNKLEIYETVKKWLEPHLPETAPYTRENAVELLARHSVLYCKPCYGRQGLGVYRVEKTEQGEIHIGDHHYVPKLILTDPAGFCDEIEKLIGTTPYMIQQGIDMKPWKLQTFDIRVLAQKTRKGLWSATNVVSRVAHQGCFNTSICEQVCSSEDILHHLYPAAQVNRLMQTIYNVSLRAAEIVELDAGYHLGEISVDLAVDPKGHPWIIELNGKPQKDLYDDIRGSSMVYRRPMDYARYLCRP